MYTLVATVFNDKDSASQAFRALHDLDGREGIKIETMHLIKKDQGGVTEELTDDDFAPPSGTLAGLALGAIIGLLGGTTGVAVAAGVGGVIGLLRDLRESESHSDFMAEVASALVPGKYAILADIKEDRVTLLDVKMRKLGGVVYRTKRSNVIRDYRARQAAKFRVEVDALIAKLAREEGSFEEKVQDAIDRMRKLLEERIEAKEARSALASQKRQVRAALLQQRAEKERKDTKAQETSRIERLRGDYERRSGG